MFDDKVEDVKEKYHVDLRKMQDEMLAIGVIDSELNAEQIEYIVKNPFIRFARVFEDTDFDEDEHESFKAAFSCKRIKR
jgi:hypothetical protein